jgi:alkylation response protein AidB-like acyl-CoA dehydrogenase
MDIHGPEGAMMNQGVDKLVRDAMIWTHLAGDSVQRMRSLRHLIH